MALTNQPWSALPSLGTPNFGLYSYGLSLSGTTLQDNTLVIGTASNVGGYAQAGGSYLKCGYLYIRVYAPGGTSPTVIVSASLTDGTTTETFLLPVAALALTTASVLRLFVPFATDLSATTITVNTTLGGTSPTASLDIAVASATGVA